MCQGLGCCLVMQPMLMASLPEPVLAKRLFSRMCICSGQAATHVFACTREAVVNGYVRIKGIASQLRGGEAEWRGGQPIYSGVSMLVASLCLFVCLFVTQSMLMACLPNLHSCLQLQVSSQQHSHSSSSAATEVVLSCYFSTQASPGRTTCSQHLAHTNVNMLPKHVVMCFKLLIAKPFF